MQTETTPHSGPRRPPRATYRGRASDNGGGRAAEERGARGPQDPGISGLLRELSEETAAYVQAEVTLARREASEKIEQVRTGAIQIAASAVILGLGLWALTAALIWGLGTALPMWAASLIVGTLVLLVGGIVLMVGKQRISRERLEPERTMRSLEKTKAMAKEHFR